MRYCGQVLFLHARHISCGGRQSSQQSRNITRHLRKQPSWEIATSEEAIVVWKQDIGDSDLDKTGPELDLALLEDLRAFCPKKPKFPQNLVTYKNSATRVTFVKTQWSKRVKRPITCPATWKLLWRHTQLLGICVLCTWVFRKSQTLFDVEHLM